MTAGVVPGGHLRNHAVIAVIVWRQAALPDFPLFSGGSCRAACTVAKLHISYVLLFLAQDFMARHVEQTRRSIDFHINVSQSLDNLQRNGGWLATVVWRGNIFAG